MRLMVNCSYSHMSDEISENSKKEQLISILEEQKIRTIFQPIISLIDGSVLGYEALSRGPAGGYFESPVNLFLEARRFKLIWELEFLCRIKAIENAFIQKLNAILFLNVDPHVLNSDKFNTGFTKDFLKNYNIDPERIVFEITENSYVEDENLFKQTIENYKGQGYRIAVDDTGSGFSGLNLVTNIHPQYIKLDMELIRNINANSLKFSLVKAMNDFCRSSNIKLIAEGIETEMELNSLIEIGVEYGQGFLIGKGTEKINPCDVNIENLIRDARHQKKIIYINGTESVFIGSISVPALSVEPCTLGKTVADIFEKQPEIFSIPVVSDGEIRGLVTRHKFYQKLGSRFGFELVPRNPIDHNMECNIMIADYYTSIDEACRRAMTRSHDKLYECIVVMKNNKYYGIVSIKTLLEKINETKVFFARHLNPLTALPGNLIVQEKLNNALISEAELTVLYLDIDNFKPYNDVYGFTAGDKVIEFIGDTMKKSVLYTRAKDSFCGHIGGDDFIIIIESCKAEEICNFIIEKFESMKPSFYTTEDYKKGFVISKSRRNVTSKYSLIGLSIAGIRIKKNTFADINDFSLVAAKTKKECKKITGDNYIIR